ncbi:DUF6790 family protein [Methylocella tundrae]|uniref:DUF4345 domain-containing protein n=1 Tax=Methylocella tundrae TaxID=227605 RepID=A0A4U8Z2Y9_METTU|nr:DUF6790 family protein [Methylocella tundrae]WPP03555.1 DUF6790 family protein [Methylocella tundrae]VFU09662.1 conserved membrane protein of unknown function [Methylocella tundrae]
MDHSIIGSLIRLVLVNFSSVLFIAALACAALDRKGPAAERTLSWLLLLPIGIGGLWSAFFHLAYPEMTARFIGWENSPFQFEVGMADLAFGVAGCAAFRASFGFRAATVLVNAIFLLGDAAGHVRQMIAAGNFAPGNAGPVFYLDIILPLASIALLLMSRPRRPAKGQ